MIETVIISRTNKINHDLVKSPIDVYKLNKTEYRTHGIAEVNVTDKYVYFPGICTCKICYTITHLDSIKSFCSNINKSLLLVIDEDDIINNNYINDIINNLTFEYEFEACILNKDDNYFFNEYEKNANFNMFYDKDLVDMRSYILTKSSARKILNYFTDSSVYKYILHCSIYDIIKSTNLLTNVITPRLSSVSNVEIQRLCVVKQSYFLQVKIEGSIGKRLFQIATAYSICREIDHILQLDVKDSKEFYNYAYRMFTINNTKINLINNLNVECTDLDKVTFKPSIFHKCYNRNVYLQGSFYTEKYFKKYKNFLKEMLEPTSTLLSYFEKTYGSLQDCAFLYIAKESFDKYELTSTFYYQKAIEMMLSNGVKKFLVFSSGRVLSKFSFFDEIDYIHVNENKLTSIQLMSVCGKGGIGSNSTCAWWGAWLNPNQTIFPDKWFKKIKELSDLYFNNCYILKVN
jgi:hypothetical protein